MQPARLGTQDIYIYISSGHTEKQHLIYFTALHNQIIYIYLLAKWAISAGLYASFIWLVYCIMYMAFIRPKHGLYTAYIRHQYVEYTAYIRPIYGLYIAYLRPSYGLYTAYRRPIYGPHVKIGYCMVEDLLANPPLLGGMGKIVELDESLIGNLKNTTEDVW